jgi:hypothetical protein
MLGSQMPKVETLRAQDVLVACKLHALAVARRDWTYLSLSGEVFMSVGEAHNSVDRCRCSGLFLPSREVSLPQLRDLLLVAIPRIFYATRGSATRGLPTSVHAAPLRGRFDVARGSLPVVWPSEDGPRSGESLRPIYPSVPAACRRDPLVHELLALADVMRVGSVAERERAVELLDERLLRRPAA